MGKPVIGARIGGIPELIRENVTGACFDSGDVGDVVVVAAIERTHPPPAALVLLALEPHQAVAGIRSRWLFMRIVISGEVPRALHSGQVGLTFSDQGSGAVA